MQEQDKQISKEELHELLQEQYFNALDRGDVETALATMDDDVEWIHTDWEGGPSGQTGSLVVQGKESLRGFLEQTTAAMERGELGAWSKVEHEVLEVIVDGNRAAFRAEMTGPFKFPFLGWVELKNGKLGKYAVTVERIPDSSGS